MGRIGDQVGMVAVEVDLEQVSVLHVGGADRQERPVAELAENLDLRRIAPGSVDVDHESGAVPDRLGGGRVVRQRVDHVFGQLDHAQARARIELALDAAHRLDPSAVVGRRGDRPGCRVNGPAELVGEQLERGERARRVPVVQHLYDARDEVVGGSAAGLPLAGPIRTLGHVAVAGMAYPHASGSEALGLEQRGVRGGDQLVGPKPARLRGGRAPADRALRTELAQELTAGRTGELLGVGERAPREHDAELVPAEPRHQRPGVGGGDRAQGVRDTPEERVAGRMAIAIVHLLQAIDVADQQRRRHVLAAQLAKALIQPAAIRQPRERILVGELRDLAEELGTPDRHRHLRGDGLQQPDVVGSEAAAAGAGCPELAPHHGLVHDRHRQLALLAQLPQQLGGRRVGVWSVDGIHVHLSLPEKLRHLAVLSQGVALVVWPALLARARAPRR